MVRSVRPEAEIMPAMLEVSPSVSSKRPMRRTTHHHYSEPSGSRRGVAGLVDPIWVTCTWCRPAPT